MPAVLDVAVLDDAVLDDAVDVAVLDDYRSMSVEEAIGMCRDLVEDPDFPTVQRWRDAGGKVVGHFQVYFPEEIVHAAGMLPFKVRGAPVEARQGESHFGSYLCSILKTSLELALSGRVTLDMFVSHPICDSARNLAAVFGRNFEYPCEILYLPQNANSAHASTYLRGEYARLTREVEAVAGRSITPEQLRVSLGVFNENRRLLRELYEIKRETPWLLSVDKAYCLMAVGGMIPREEHNQLLAWAIPPDPQGFGNAAGPDASRLHGRFLRAATAGPAAHHRAVLLRRG